jgi:hypothetical protein
MLGFESVTVNPAAAGCSGGSLQLSKATSETIGSRAKGRAVIGILLQRESVSEF